MENNHDNRRDQEHQGGTGKEINLTNSDRSIPQQKSTKPDGPLPEDDPAIINPDELATFPKERKNTNPDLDEERDSHSVNLKSSPVREGRNITNTDTKPDENGFM